jgi:sugar phosphate isomerase/epimerase
VAAVVEAAGDAVGTTESGAVLVHEEWREKGPPLPTATVETRLVLARLEAAGDLVGALGRLDDVSVSGPFWRLRPDSPVHAEARLAALRDAVRRAREYAAALGSELTALVEVADTGLSGGAPRFARAAAGMARFEAADLALDLTPAPQEVHGSVEVRFTIRPPDLEDLPT